jgi:hypothetical protein
MFRLSPGLISSAKKVAITLFTIICFLFYLDYRPEYGRFPLPRPSCDNFRGPFTLTAVRFIPRWSSKHANTGAVYRSTRKRQVLFFPPVYFSNIFAAIGSLGLRLPHALTVTSFDLLNGLRRGEHRYCALWEGVIHPIIETCVFS